MQPRFDGSTAIATSVIPASRSLVCAGCHTCLAECQTAERPVRSGHGLAGRTPGVTAGVSVLAGLITRIRERADARLYRKLARMPSAQQRDQLKELLVVSAGARRSPLDRLRRGPTQPTGAGLVQALRRLIDVPELGVDELDLSDIPAGRLNCWHGMPAPRALRRSSACQPSATSRRCSRSLARCRQAPRMTCWTSWTCCSPTCWPAWKVRRRGVDYAPSVIWT
jgi:hypothetical protein